MVRGVNVSQAQAEKLRECRASSGRYWASSLIKRLRVTTGEPSRQTRSRKTRTLRHAGGYKGTGWSDAEAAQFGFLFRFHERSLQLDCLLQQQVPKPGEKVSSQRPALWVHKPRRRRRACQKQTVGRDITYSHPLGGAFKLGANLAPVRMGYNTSLAAQTAASMDSTIRPRVYGLHWMLNIVTGEVGDAAASLFAASRASAGQAASPRRSGLTGRSTGAKRRP
jgi:hypothetical protein